MAHLNFHISFFCSHLQPELDGLTDVVQRLIARLTLGVTPRKIQAAHRPTLAGAFTLSRLASSKLQIVWGAGTLRSSLLLMHATHS